MSQFGFLDLSLFLLVLSQHRPQSRRYHSAMQVEETRNANSCDRPDAGLMPHRAEDHFSGHYEDLFKSVTTCDVDMPVASLNNIKRPSQRPQSRHSKTQPEIAVAAVEGYCPYDDIAFKGALKKGPSDEEWRANREQWKRNRMLFSPRLLIRSR